MFSSSSTSILNKLNKVLKISKRGFLKEKGSAAEENINISISSFCQLDISIVCLLTIAYGVERKVSRYFISSLMGVKVSKKSSNNITECQLLDWQECLHLKFVGASLSRPNEANTSICAFLEERMPSVLKAAITSMLLDYLNISPKLPHCHTLG